MKCSNFWGEHQAIRDREYAELKAAIEAHGGEYVFIPTDDETGDIDWDNEPEDGFPNVVIVGATEYSGDTNWRVTRVDLAYGIPTIYAVLDEAPGYEHELKWVAFGHLQYIIEEIPETDAVKDVTIKK